MDWAFQGLSFKVNEGGRAHTCDWWADQGDGYRGKRGFEVALIMVMGVELRWDQFSMFSSWSVWPKSGSEIAFFSATVSPDVWAVCNAV